MVPLLRLALVALALVVAYLVAVFVLQRRIVFPCGAVVVAADPPFLAGGELVRLPLDPSDADGGSVEAFFLPARGDAVGPAPVVIFAHGNGEAIDYWVGELGAYRDLGVSVLLPEYRGYGRSAGSPSEAGIVADFVRFREWLLQRSDVDAERLVYHGRSLGGGALCGLSRHAAPAAMILQSSFTSLTVMARSMGVPAFLVRDPFDNLSAVSSYDGPLLLIHGRADEVIPYRHAEALAAAAPRAQLLTYAEGHNDLPRDPARFWADVETFLRGAGILGGP